MAGDDEIIDLDNISDEDFKATLKRIEKREAALQKRFLRGDKTIVPRERRLLTQGRAQTQNHIDQLDETIDSIPNDNRLREQYRSSRELFTDERNRIENRSRQLDAEYDTIRARARRRPTLRSRLRNAFRRFRLR